MISSSCLRLLPCLKVTSILPSIFPSITCFKRQFRRKCDKSGQNSFFLFLQNILIFFTLRNTSSFLTPSVQMVFFILLRHHVSKLSRYFCSTFRSVQFAAPQKATLKMQHFTSFCLRIKSSLPVKKKNFLLNAAFATAIPDLNFIFTINPQVTNVICIWSTYS